jgi:hypothetical protein
MKFACKKNIIVGLMPYIFLNVVVNAKHGFSATKIIEVTAYSFTINFINY